MRLKRVLAVLICLIMIFSLSACGSDENAETDDNEKTAAQLAAEERGESSDDIGKVLDSEGQETKPSGLSAKVSADWDEKYEYGNLSIGKIGDTLSNAFFDWTVNSVTTAEKVSGKSADSGKKFLVINITVKNTADYSYAIGNYDFIGITGTGDGDELDTEDSFYSEMYPDEQELGVGKSITGDIVIQVKSDANELILDYEEFYGDGSIGNTNWFNLTF